TLRFAAIEPTSSSGARVEVVIENRAEGHDLPDGASFLREMWVSLEVEVSGAVVFASGIEDAEAPWLSSRIARNGEEVVLPTDGDTVVAHAVPAKSSRSVHFEVPS